MDYAWFKGFIDPAYWYNFHAGPKQVRSPEDAFRFGNNCVALGHLSLKQIFGYELDPSQHCYEMFTDHERFATVDLDEMRTGDLVWFGWEDPAIPIDKFEPQYDSEGYLLNWQDMAVNHVAVYTGLQQDGEPLLLHASPTDGTNTMWPIGEFAHYPRYRQIHRVSRLIIESHQERNAL